MGVSPTGGGGIKGCVDLHIPSSEHSCTVHCDQAHCGSVYGGRDTPVDKGAQAVVGAGEAGLGEDV